MSIAAAAGMSGLSACGGGGGDEPTSEAYDVRAAAAKLEKFTGSMTLTGTGSDGHAYRYTETSVAAADAVFPLTGANASRLVDTQQFRRDGVVTGSSRSEEFFDLATGELIGSRLDGGSCAEVTHRDALPTSARVGRVGPLGTATRYVACTRASGVAETSSATWSLERDRGVVLLCSNTSYSTAQGTQSQCYEIEPDGSVRTKRRLTVVIFDPNGNFTLVARNW